MVRLILHRKRCMQTAIHIHLVHPIAPEGCEMFREYLNVGEELWDWNHIFEPISFFVGDVEKHKLKYLEPRVDFFKKHDCQLAEKTTV